MIIFRIIIYFTIFIIKLKFFTQNVINAEKLTKRIIGGEPVNILSFNHHVSIKLNGKYSCGGSMITRKCILTAAHCFDNFLLNKNQSVKISAGIDNLKSKNGFERNIETIIIPPFYNNITLHNDYAILKMKQPIQHSNVTPICLNKEPLYAGMKGIVTGFGVTDEMSSIPSEQLRMVQIIIISKKLCKYILKNETEITNSMFCGHNKDENQDTCKGDSGGPMIRNNKQIGIVSFGIGCANEYPAVYTNIRTMIKWAKNITMMLGCDSICT